MPVPGVVVAAALLFSTTAVSALADPACSAGEIHDPTGPSTAVAITCSDPNLSAHWVQLFSPPRVPWRYTRVCAALRESLSAPRSENVTIIFYSARYDPEMRLYKPYSLIHSVPFQGVPVPGVSATASVDLYQGFNVSFVVYERRVFVGTVALGCTMSVRVGACYDQSCQSVLWGRASQPTWTCLGTSCPKNNRTIRALAFRAEGRHESEANGTAPGWTCGVGAFRDGVCHCGCGVEDPDCFEVSRESPNCTAGTEICLEGTCVAHGWNTSKPGCDVNLIASDGVCQCGCGSLVDPDCLSLDAISRPLSPLSCQGKAVPVCTSSGTCIDRWTCDPSLYNDSVCTCKFCGIPDPDCTAGLHDDCPANLTCKSNVCVPPLWSCAVTLYNERGQCNCRCSVYDPDCDDRSLQIIGCDPGQECGYESQCLFPRCPNQHVDINEECDGDAATCDSRTCRCKSGYIQRNPPRLSCVPRCNNSIKTPDEECDGSKFCNQETCKCLPDHVPSVDVAGVCVGCGNGVVEDSEQCDGGSGCFWNNCTCRPLYVPTEPRNGSCALRDIVNDSTHSVTSDPKKSDGTLLTVLVVVTVGVICAAALVALAISLILVLGKRKRRLENVQTTVGASVGDGGICMVPFGGPSDFAPGGSIMVLNGSPVVSVPADASAIAGPHAGMVWGAFPATIFASDSMIAGTSPVVSAVPYGGSPVMSSVPYGGSGMVPESALASPCNNESRSVHPGLSSGSVSSIGQPTPFAASSLSQGILHSAASVVSPLASSQAP